MVTVEANDCVAEIGKTAGQVWHTLSEDGPMSFPRLAREIGVHRDIVMQAVGWLAREGKVAIEEGTRGRTVSLKTSDVHD